MGETCIPSCRVRWGRHGRRTETRIAFAQSEALGTSATDGTDVQYVNATYDGCSVNHSPPLAWSPDGTELVSNGELECLGTTFEGSCRTEIATGAAVCEAHSGEQTYEDWSPDSRWILVGTVVETAVSTPSGTGTSSSRLPAVRSTASTATRRGRQTAPRSYFAAILGSASGSPQMYLIDAADGERHEATGRSACRHPPRLAADPDQRLPAPRGREPDGDLARAGLPALQRAQPHARPAAWLWVVQPAHPAARPSSRSAPRTQTARAPGVSAIVRVTTRDR